MSFEIQHINEFDFIWWHSILLNVSFYTFKKSHFFSKRKKFFLFCYFFFWCCFFSELIFIGFWIFYLACARLDFYGKIIQLSIFLKRKSCSDEGILFFGEIIKKIFICFEFYGFHPWVLRICCCCWWMVWSFEDYCCKMWRRIQFLREKVKQLWHAGLIPG